MKTLTYALTIEKPRDFVFRKVTDKSVYPEWAKAWGEGMTFEGAWEEGEHISFFDHTQGGTKARIDEIIPNEVIKTTHVAMVNPENVEVPLTDEMMRKWVGSTESYFFKAISDTETMLEVVMTTDEAFEEMMQAWPTALQLLKEICES